MAYQGPSRPTPNGKPPALPADPQVILTVVDGQVQLTSNIEPNEAAWLFILQVCLEGSRGAAGQLAQATEEGSSRIVKPLGSVPPWKN